MLYIRVFFFFLSIYLICVVVWWIWVVIYKMFRILNVVLCVIFGLINVVVINN